MSLMRGVQRRVPIQIDEWNSELEVILHEVRTDEPGSAGDQQTHVTVIAHASFANSSSMER